MDRTAEESKGTFGSRIAALDADIVIDMISFELDGTQQLVQALHGRADAVRQPVHRSHSAYGYGVPTSAPLASKHWV